MDLKQPNITKIIGSDATVSARKLLYQNEGNKFLRFTYNVIRAVQSNASAEEYWAILRDLPEANFHLALISFPLSEYLCFSGAPEEVFEVVVPGVGFQYESICRFDNDFVEVIYHHDGEHTQVFGTPSAISEYKAQNFPTANKFAITTLKTFLLLRLQFPKFKMMSKTHLFGGQHSDLLLLV